ncbi:MAG TPA: GNAT family N-acetyltransferase [Gemmatimonadaceae bacterium]|nr:GNAT family N-acetyltransferase [Gemmatimonadaceae bacterium]
MTSLLLTVEAEIPDGWDELAAAAGSFYHRRSWVAGLARCFGFRAQHVVAREDGRVTGILPLLEVPALLGPRRLVSLPFSYMAGPLAERGEVRSALLDRAIEIARDRRIRRLEVKVGVDAGSPRPGYQRSSAYNRYLVDTREGEQAVWKRLHASHVQRGIRKSQKSGLIVDDSGTPASWLAMAELQEETSRRLGLPSPPRRFFVELGAELHGQGLADVLIARTADGSAVAGITIWKGGSSWIYGFGASLPAHWDLRPNHLLLWTALRQAIAAGVSFDLGRAAPGQRGLVEFKERWGGVAEPLAYDYWPEARGLNVARRDGGPIALANAVWSRLPLAVTRRAAFLYRYLG